jgi:hypothetical protein
MDYRLWTMDYKTVDYGRERSEGEEPEATRGSTKGGAEWCTGFREPAGQYTHSRPGAS